MAPFQNEAITGTLEAPRNTFPAFRYGAIAIDAPGPALRAVLVRQPGNMQEGCRNGGDVLPLSAVVLLDFSSDI